MSLSTQSRDAEFLWLTLGAIGVMPGFKVFGGRSNDPNVEWFSLADNRCRTAAKYSNPSNRP
ncbi:hypothetical protein ACWC2T_08930 [Streptomyces sp. NPDC001393]